jgi:hypothetical protein
MRQCDQKVKGASRGGEMIVPLLHVVIYFPNSVRDEKARSNNDDHTSNSDP